MGRWIWGTVILVAIGALYWAWPFVGAVEFAAAARRGDSAEVIERVNMPALRRSLAKQIALAYLKASGKGGKMGSFGQSLAGAAATTIADPYLAQLLTPENITSLIGQGKISKVTLGNKEMAFDRGVPSFSSLLNTDWISMVTGSYFDGIADFVIPVEAKQAGETAPESYNVHFRLDGLTWRLSGIDLPSSVIDELARSLLAQNGEKPVTQ